MKKLLIVVGIVASMQLAHAQRSVSTELPNKLFWQGKEMFLDNNYVGALHQLEEFKRLSKEHHLTEEANYMLVCSKYYQGTADANNAMKEYLENYPETIHRNELNFLIGSVHFSEKDWKKALYWLSEADVKRLAAPQQDDCTYRTAYANLQAGNNADAQRQFASLAGRSFKYADGASYYYAYILFKEGKTAQATPIFRKLKNKGEYAENSTFFLIQAAFAEGKTAETIGAAQDYLKTYPQSTNNPEVYRMLGSSYYRTGKMNAAIENYEKYANTNTDTELFREDMYQLGDAYYQSGKYAKAVLALQKVASTDDQLGQAGNMLLGQSYLKLNDTASALMAFDAASRSTFDSTISEEALYNYVMLMHRESVSVFGQSITAFQRFLTEYPVSKHADDVNGALANTLLSTKNYNMALDVINKIKSPGKQVLDAKQIILFEQGVQQFIDGHNDAALRGFTATIGMGNYNAQARSEAYFWRGETHYRMGNYTAASKDYTSYAEQSSTLKNNYVLALYNIGYTDFQTKNYNRALDSFKKYTLAETNRQAPSYGDALNRIGDCYLYSRNFTDAERSYTDAMSSNPTNADYSEFQKAFVMGLQHNYAGKVTALNNMMAKYPKSEYYDDALFEKSRALVMQNKEPEAIATLENLLSERPTTSFAQKAGVQLGQLYFNTNNPQRSISAYKQAIAVNPKTDDARAGIKSLEGVYKDINDISAYASYVNSLGGSNAISTNRQDSLTYLAAENLYMKGLKMDSKNAMNNYLKNFPRGRFVSDAHYYIGSMDYDAKNVAGALTHFKEVILDKNPKYVTDALIYASGMEFDNKNYEASYNYYDQLDKVATKPDDKDVAQLGMLRCAYLLKKDSEVIAAAKKLIDNQKTQPDVSFEARFYRGQSLRNTGKMNDAIADLQKVSTNTRTIFGAESQYILADMYYNAKSYDKAEKLVTEFMKQGTPHEYWLARAIIVLSDTYAAKGDAFRARQYLESLQANYKGNEADITDMINKRLAVAK